MATCPVTLSSLDDGQIVNGLAGIPSNGPVILVGYHMLMSIELGPMFIRFIGEKNIHLRGVGQPFLFNRNSEMLMFNSSSFDGARTMGAVPVSRTSIYKLLSQKSFVLLARRTNYFGLIDYDAAFLIWKVDKFDFIACMGAFIGVVFGSVEIGLMIAVLISFAKILLQVTRPRTAILGNLLGATIYRNIEQCPDGNRVPGVLVVRVDSAIYFTNPNYVKERILRWLIDEEEKL